jgi:hypothetical protein
VDQFAGERRGDGQGDCAVRLGQIGPDEDFEGAVSAGGAVPAFAGGLGAPAVNRRGIRTPLWG